MRHSHVALGLTLVLLFVACNRKAFVAHGPVPAPPSQQVTFAGSTPSPPFHLEEGNVLSRIAFQATGPSSSVIEIRDYLLPPHAKSSLPVLPGPALFETHSGEGFLSLGQEGQKSERLVPGQMRSIPAGQALVIDNQGAHPMAVRAFVVEVK